MKKAPTSSPARWAAQTASRDCATVVCLFISRRTSSLPDSMPKKTVVQPARRIRRAVGSSRASTRPRHSQVKRRLRRSISSQIATTRSRRSVKTSSANAMWS